MNVGELRSALKGFKNTDQVYFVADWEAVDDAGRLCELRPLLSVEAQPADEGKDVLLEF